jgi:small-conductance mechanosensitive channel
VPNFISGIYLYSRENLKRGTHVEIGEIKGVFQKIEMLHIRIETQKGDTIYIPNTTAANTKIVVKKTKN